jgi:hypothetical protein
MCAGALIHASPDPPPHLADIAFCHPTETQEKPTETQEKPAYVGPASWPVFLEKPGRCTAAPDEPPPAVP